MAAGNLFPLLTEQRKAYFSHQSISLLLSVICSGRPIEMESHIFWFKSLKLDFFALKDKFLLKVKIKYQQFNAKGRPFN
jgi:hypothetical protein